MTRIMIEYDGVNNDSGRSGDSDKKFASQSMSCLAMLCWHSGVYQTSIEFLSKVLVR